MTIFVSISFSNNVFMVDTFGYIIGGFALIFFFRIAKLNLMVLITILPSLVCSGLLLYAREYLDNSCFLVGVFLLNFNFGVNEVLNIRLLIANSNRPEFFVGMLYFLGYLIRAILVVFITYFIFRFITEQILLFFLIFIVFNLVGALILLKALSETFNSNSFS